MEFMHESRFKNFISIVHTYAYSIKNVANGDTAGYMWEIQTDLPHIFTSESQTHLRSSSKRFRILDVVLLKNKRSMDLLIVLDSGLTQGLNHVLPDIYSISFWSFELGDEKSVLLGTHS